MPVFFRALYRQSGKYPTFQSKPMHLWRLAGVDMPLSTLMTTTTTTPLDLSGPDEPHAKPRMGLARVESDSEDTQDQYQNDGNDLNMSENGDSVVYYEQQTSPGSTEGRPAAPGGQAKRFRTQMSSVQIRIMKSIFHDYKTPTMAECESLGAQIGLPKRVIQVWFQNARAKEKKTKAAALKMGQVPELEPARPEQCDICNIRYESFSSSLQDHLFSPSHISQIRAYLELNKDEPEQSQQAGGGHSSGPPLPISGQQHGPSSGAGGDQASSAFGPEHSQLVQQLQLLSQLNLQQEQQQQQQQASLEDSVDVTSGKSTGDTNCNNNPASNDDFSLFTSSGAGGVNGGQNQFSAFFGAQSPGAPLFSSASRQ